MEKININSQSFYSIKHLIDSWLDIQIMRLI